LFHKLKSNDLSLLVLVGAFFVLLDLFFFNKGLVFSLIVTTGMIYIGKRRMHKRRGKLLFWAGVIFLILNVLNMITIKFFILALLVLLILQFSQNKKKPTIITPTINNSVNNSEDKSETIIKEQTLFRNIFFGQQKTPEHVYDWNDINIQAGIGDSIIDLSYTVLPKGETVIFIRNVIGKITVFVPYDIEVSVNHSAYYGSVRILDFYESQIFNRMIKVETPEYQPASQKVKILTSTVIGDIEVKRV
jgi:lia operon protein LiaF